VLVSVEVPTVVAFHSQFMRSEGNTNLFPLAVDHGLDEVDCDVAVLFQEFHIGEESIRIWTGCNSFFENFFGLP